MAINLDDICGCADGAFLGDREWKNVALLLLCKAGSSTWNQCLQYTDGATVTFTRVFTRAADGTVTFVDYNNITGAVIDTDGQTITLCE